MAVTNSPLLSVVATLGTAKMDFLIDTGAATSIIPKRLVPNLNLKPTAVRLTSASGAEIAAYGEAFLNISILKLRRSFHWNFLVADVTHPLLGIDFLQHFELTIDCKRKSLLDNVTNSKVSVNLLK